LAVIEDAACSAGAAFDGEPVGSQFDVSVFSLHPRKVITTGEGGIVTTDDDDLERELRSLKNFGTDPSGDHEGFRRSDATNYRMSDLLAAVGVSQLDKLDKIIGTRRRLASRYDDLLADIEGVRTPHVPTEAEHVFQSYCVYIKAGEEMLRDQLMDVLASAGIETQIGTYAVHRTDAFADAKRTGSLETSSALYDSLLTLPMAHSMDDDQQQRVVDTLRSGLRSQTSTA
jgi:dTDP-4-amino-4,6-dideoxygalactose transaminase